MNDETCKHLTADVLETVCFIGEIGGEWIDYDSILEDGWSYIEYPHPRMAKALNQYIPELVREWVTTYGDNHESPFMEWLKVEWFEAITEAASDVVKSFVEGHNENLPDDPDEGYLFWAATRGV